MKLFVLAVLLGVAEGLAVARTAFAPVVAQPAAMSARAALPTMQFGSKKKMTVEEKLEAKGYWAGEWVCADCGYIYEPGTEPPFEELRNFWKCPQCAGPRRRFVKKAGNMVGNLDDTPLIVGTAAGFLAIAGLAWAAVQ